MDENFSNSLSDEEIDGVLEHLADVSGDLQAVMDQTFKDLLFIGGTVRNASEMDKDAFNLSMRLCTRYNQKIENYERLRDLHALAQQVAKGHKVELDRTIVNEIKVNNN